MKPSVGQIVKLADQGDELFLIMEVLSNPECVLVYHSQEISKVNGVSYPRRRVAYANKVEIVYKIGDYFQYKAARDRNYLLNVYVYMKPGYIIQSKGYRINQDGIMMLKYMIDDPFSKELMFAELSDFDKIPRA